MKILNPEGWVPIAPDGLVYWNGGSFERQRCIHWTVACCSDLLPPYDEDDLRAEWRRMYRKGWRIVRCQLADRGKN